MGWFSEAVSSPMKMETQASGTTLKKSDFKKQHKCDSISCAYSCDKLGLGPIILIALCFIFFLSTKYICITDLKSPGSYVDCLLFLLICKQRKVRRTAKWSDVGQLQEQKGQVVESCQCKCQQKGQNRYVKEDKEVAGKQLKAIPPPASGKDPAHPANYRDLNHWWKK